MSYIPQLEPSPGRAWKYLLSIIPIVVSDLQLHDKAVTIINHLYCLPNKDMALKGLLAELDLAKDKASFNLTLDKIYDWADEHNVWMGVVPDESMQDS